MNTKPILLVSALAVAALSNAQAVPGGSLIVLREGDGSAALSSVATPIFFDNFNTGGSILNSFAVPTTGGGAVTNSGSATSEGSINYANGQISFVGYRADAGTTGVVGTTSAAVNRIVGTFNTNTGAIGTAGTISDQFSANNIRSAVLVGNAYYAGGANTAPSGGLVSSTVGGTTTTPLGTTTTNVRVVSAFDNGVYFSTGSTTGGTSIGVYQYTPGTTGNQTLVVATGGSPYGFQFLTATSLLVADDNATTGGLKLYTNSGAGFTLASQLTLTTQPRSFVAVGNSIYYTTASGLFSTSLVGSTFGTATQLATAGTNTAFRGVAFVPQAVPEPSAFAALGLGTLGLLRRRRASK